MYLNYYPHTRVHETREALEREYYKTQGIIRTVEIEELHNERKDDITVTLDLHSWNIQRQMRALAELPNPSTPWNNVCNAVETKNLYQTFRIPKRSGGFRTISAPTDRLKNLQQEFLEMFQKSLKILPHNAAHGCVKKRNCKTALQVHQKNNSKWFLKLDLHDAFGSVHKSELRQAIENSAIMYYALIEAEHYFNAELTNLIGTLLAVTFNNNVSTGLPQGSPLSPFMLNVYMQRFDEDLTKFCKDRGLMYTRYVDDLLISGYEKFDKDEVLTFVRAALPPNMELNNEKTRFGSINWKNWNLGIMLNKDNKLTPGSNNKHKLKCAIHNYNNNPDLQTRENYAHLSGLLAYYKYIEPEYFENNPHYSMVVPTAVATLPVELV